MKALIADDESQLLTHLRMRLSEEWPELMICGEAKNGLEAIEMIEKMKPEVAFLDIRMPGMTGLEVAGRVAGKCMIVFITAYDQYAIDAFDSEAVDYLLKPVSSERLRKTVERIKKNGTAPVNEKQDLADAIERVVSKLAVQKPKECLSWIKTLKNDSIRLISVSEVVFFQATDKYTSVVTQNGEYLIKKPIKELEEELDADKFWRIHRATIVNVKFIEKVSTSLTGRLIVKMKSHSELLTVSRSYTHLFKQM